MLDVIRSEGEQLGDAELEESDVIVPPPDTSMAEAAAEFSGDGLIPD
jgi:glutamine phosphoribosylpyrophosphate amidotransferase